MAAINRYMAVIKFTPAGEIFRVRVLSAKLDGKVKDGGLVDIQTSEAETQVDFPAASWRWHNFFLGKVSILIETANLNIM